MSTYYITSQHTRLLGAINASRFFEYFNYVYEMYNVYISICFAKSAFMFLRAKDSVSYMLADKGLFYGER